MEFEDLTTIQKYAVTSYGKNIIVSAGAGSGKTAVLTQRVLYFIKNEGFHLDEFLILTFTKLAAGEMKERIRSTLRKHNLPDAEIVDSCAITTFDAYALSVVKKYHFLLNVPNDIAIIDTGIIDVYKRKVIEELFEEYYSKNDELFNNFINRFVINDDASLCELTLKLHKAASLNLSFDDYLDNFTEKYYSDELIEEIESHYLNKLIVLKKKIISLISLLPNVPLKKGVTETYKEVFEKRLKNFVDSSDNYEDIMSTFPLNYKENIIFKGLDPDEKQIKEEFVSSCDEMLSLISILPNSHEEFVAYFKDNIEYSNLLIELVKKTEARVQMYKKEHNVYEFQDIAKMALNLVKNNQEIADEIKKSLRMIMIDEYQDTSELQEKFISYISDNDVYMVGDIKQSIYRFRNAKCDIFRDKYLAYKNNIGGIAIDLNTNFRSSQEVLNDINFIFKQIMTIEYGGADYLNQHLIEYGNLSYRKSHDDGKKNNSSFIVYNIDDYKSGDRPNYEARLVCLDILNKINSHYQVLDTKKNDRTRDCTYSDFCILMDRGKQFDEYAKVFNEYKIPLFVENDEDISDNTIVLVLKNLLKIINCIKNNKYDTTDFVHAYLSLARSFIFSYTDQQLYDLSQLECQNHSTYKNDYIINKIKNVIDNNKTDTLYELIFKIVIDLDIYHKFIFLGDVKKNEEYLDIFLSMFKQMSDLSYSIEDFINYLDYVDKYNLKINVSSKGSSIDSVRIMNVHKSKGLEFPIVYFSGLYVGFNKEEQKQEFGVSSKYGLILPPKEPSKLNITRELNNEYEEKEDISEKLRLFYVALTRTREKMIFVLPIENEKCAKINQNAEKVFFNEYLKTHKEKPLNSIIDDYNNDMISKNILEILLNGLNYRLNDDLLKLNEIELRKHILMEEDLIKLEDIKEETLIDRLVKKEIDEKLIDKIKKINIDVHLSDFEVIKNLYYDDVITNKEFLYLCTELFIFLPGLDLGNKILDSYYKKMLSLDDTKSLLENLGIEVDFDTNNIISLSTNENQKNYHVNNKESYYYTSENLKYILLSNYVNKYYDLKKLEGICDVLNYKLTTKFYFSINENIPLDLNDLIAYIVSKGIIQSCENACSFKDFIDPFVFTPTFTQYSYVVNKVTNYQKKSEEKEEQQKLLIIPLEIEKKVINHEHASKKLMLESNKESMEFGTQLHFIMEITDFKNPDYSILGKYGFVVKNFLSLEINKKIKEGIIFKEYEFENEVSGVIDLMIIYEDHIDIFDYKTINIDDESYTKQVKIYQKFAFETFKKETNIYLYSLLKGTIKKID